MMPCGLKPLVRIAGCILTIWALYLLRANIWFRLYPVVIVSIAFFSFALSLAKTPLVETFARKMGNELDENGMRYCRKLTIVWTVFLAIHLGVTMATVFASHEIWALYNGCISYILMGTLFAGEILYRKRVRRG